MPSASYWSAHLILTIILRCCFYKWGNWGPKRQVTNSIPHQLGHELIEDWLYVFILLLSVTITVILTVGWLNTYLMRRKTKAITLTWKDPALCKMTSYSHGQGLQVRKWNIHVKDKWGSSQITVQLLEKIWQHLHKSLTPTHSHILDFIIT